MIHEAWIGGVSTRPVDKVVQTMGLSRIAKSQVSKLRRAGSTNAAKRKRPWTSPPTIHNGRARDGVRRVPLQLPHDSLPYSNSVLCHASQIPGIRRSIGAASQGINQ